MQGKISLSSFLRAVTSAIEGLLKYITNLYPLLPYPLALTLNFMINDMCFCNKYLPCTGGFKTHWHLGYTGTDSIPDPSVYTFIVRNVHCDHVCSKEMLRKDKQRKRA